jgi:hypothetical protein
MQDMKTMASTRLDELNRFLSENGFTIQLENLNGGFGVVAILDRLVHWIFAGNECVINVSGVSYPAFRLEDGIEFYTSAEHPNPLVSIMTETCDRVWLTVADSECSGLELFEKIRLIKSSPLRDNWTYGRVVVPETLIDLVVNIDFLLGLSTTDEHDTVWMITQAVQQLKFAMNAKGAHLKVATGLGLEMAAAPMSEKELVLDKPFFMWIEPREGGDLPMGALLIAEDSWKKADLDQI